MAVTTIAVRLQDDEQDTRLATIPFHVASGGTLANIQLWTDAMLPLLDLVTGAQIVEASVTVPLSLVGGLKASPASGALNERGGLILFQTNGNHRDSVRIPAILTSIMPGDTFALDGTAMANFIAQLNLTVNSHRALTVNEDQWGTALSGKKSFRRK